MAGPLKQSPLDEYSQRSNLPFDSIKAINPLNEHYKHGAEPQSADVKLHQKKFSTAGGMDNYDVTLLED